MSVSEVLLQNLIPKNFLDSDDEIESWVSSSENVGQSNGDIQTSKQDDSDFRVFQDYFGLSNLLQNIKISEDNPLLYEQYRKPLFPKVRRFSWESDASDPSAAISPTLPNMPYSLGSNGDFPLGDGTLSRSTENGFKQLPPPSLRLSKAMRDQIINGAYQQQILQAHRPEKVVAGPPSPLQGSGANTTAVRPQAAMQVCVFCRNNGESEAVYSSHVLKDAEGRTSCPILRAYTCPICKANGDNSHTIKYCPLNQNGANRNLQQAQQTMQQNGLRNRTVRPPPITTRMNLKAR